MKNSLDITVLLIGERDCNESFKEDLLMDLVERIVILCLLFYSMEVEPYFAFPHFFHFLFFVENSFLLFSILLFCTI